MLYLGAKRSLLSSGLTLEQQIAALFRSGEQGACYEPSLANGTLFQDSAGTTPVTAVGQPVGLMLDKRQGLVRGAERFDSAAPVRSGGWLANGDGSYTKAAAGSVNGNVTTLAALELNKFYEATVTVVAVTGVLRVIFGSTTIISLPTTPGTYKVYGFCVGSTTAHVNAGAESGGTVRDISFRELPGNPALQATTTARPLNQVVPARLAFDAVDDQHVTTFPSALGSTCTVIRSVPGVGASILTGQTIGTTYTNTATHSGLLIINRALTAGETASAVRWANQRAFA